MRVGAGLVAAARSAAILAVLLGAPLRGGCLLVEPRSAAAAAVAGISRNNKSGGGACWFGKAGAAAALRPLTNAPRGNSCRRLGCPPPRRSRLVAQSRPVQSEADDPDEGVVRRRPSTKGERDADEGSIDRLVFVDDSRDLESAGSSNSRPGPPAPVWSLSGVVEGLTERQRGVLALLTVPAAWGTFEPAVRYVYAEADPPVPPFAFSLAYYAVAAATLGAFAALEGGTAPPPSSSPGSAEETKRAALGSGAAADPPLAELPAGPRTPPETAAGGGSGPPESGAAAVATAGGIELGAYLFAGNALQLLGLRTVPAGRAAFLLQLTTVLVPLLEAGAARSARAVPARVWGACAVALAGVFVMGLDGGGGIDPSPPAPGGLSLASFQVAPGDLLVVGAAAAYTLHCVRLEDYARRAPSAVRLASAKATTEAALTFAAVVAFVSCYFALGGGEGAAAAAAAGDSALLRFAVDSGRGLVEYAAALGAELAQQHQPAGEGGGAGAPLLASLAAQWPAAAATLWCGWVTIAYTIYAQSYGQRRVRPATANLIYTAQPIFTAAVAWLVLGEAMGPAGYAGGALVGAAVLLVVSAPPNP
jgi:drug/metabolite transporter (DMT)-like permease